MGTRSGDIDPGILEVLAKMENKDVSEITNILNKNQVFPACHRFQVTSEI